MRYHNVTISVLRIKNFLITNDKGYRAVKKKWKEAPFKVEEELTEDDLREIQGPINDEDEDPDFQDDPDSDED